MTKEELKKFAKEETDNLKKQFEKCGISLTKFKEENKVYNDMSSLLKEELKYLRMDEAITLGKYNTSLRFLTEINKL